MNPAIWLAALTGLGVTSLFVLLRKKNAHIWLPGYVRRRFRRRARVTGVQDVLFCFADHFEPEWRRPAPDIARERVQRWLDAYPALAKAHQDADGRSPVHTFFFPEEEYKPEYIEMLAAICRQGCGELEVHLHHDNDTSEGFREKLEQFKRTLRAHDCLARDRFGVERFGFIHGNWCLDNSSTDGRWCGVNDEIRILAQAGCYADFTLPAAPNSAQTRQVNSIYYAIDDPASPKSHDTGVAVRVLGRDKGDLMLFQGVLALNWRQRSRGLFPRIENSELSPANPPTPARIDLWIREAVAVEGRPEWIFVKIHAHGAGESDADILLGRRSHAMYDYLERKYNDGTRYRLHYVSAREMYNIARAAEDGYIGNPDQYRDYEIRRPGYGVQADYSVRARQGDMTRVPKVNRYRGPDV